MTMDERIEAAARAHDPDWWESADEEARDIVRVWMRRAIAAAFPELSGDKPTHWLAPIFATTKMIDAPTALFKSDGPLRSASLCWVLMRDAYLGKGDGG